MLASPLPYSCTRYLFLSTEYSKGGASTKPFLSPYPPHLPAPPHPLHPPTPLPCGHHDPRGETVHRYCLVSHPSARKAARRHRSGLLSRHTPPRVRESRRRFCSSRTSLSTPLSVLILFFWESHHSRKVVKRCEKRRDNVTEAHHTHRASLKFTEPNQRRMSVTPHTMPQTSHFPK